MRENEREKDTVRAIKQINKIIKKKKTFNLDFIA